MKLIRNILIVLSLGLVVYFLVVPKELPDPNEKIYEIVRKNNRCN